MPLALRRFRNPRTSVVALFALAVAALASLKLLAHAGRVGYPWCPAAASRSVSGRRPINGRTSATERMQSTQELILSLFAAPDRDNASLRELAHLAKRSAPPQRCPFVWMPSSTSTPGRANKTERFAILYRKRMWARKRPIPTANAAWCGPLSSKHPQKFATAIKTVSPRSCARPTASPFSRTPGWPATAVLLAETFARMARILIPSPREDTDLSKLFSPHVSHPQGRRPLFRHSGGALRSRRFPRPPLPKIPTPGLRSSRPCWMPCVCWAPASRGWDSPNNCARVPASDGCSNRLFIVYRAAVTRWFPR